MPDTNDDDYVVSLLLKDAEANRKRYLSNSGLGSLLSSSSRKDRANAPKPNTRFLKNIVREADSHNAALKAREEEESAARLRDMREGKRKRDRDEEVGGRVGGVEKKRKEDRPGRWGRALGGLSKGGRGEGSGRHRDRRHELSRERDEARRHRRRRDDSDRSRSRSRSPGHRKEHRRIDRARTPSRWKDKATYNSDDASDSDPLETILGPKPAPTILPRGRGAHKTSASDSIDRRFSSSFNPKTDVDLSPDNTEGDDWDMALEALRDRAKWRAQGADRLRAAGFTEDEVGRWENNAAFPNGGAEEKDVEDVRWSKKGEGREWDRGKVVGKDTIETGPEWGRLKGS